MCAGLLNKGLTVFSSVQSWTSIASLVGQQGPCSTVTEIKLPYSIGSSSIINMPKRRIFELRSSAGVGLRRHFGNYVLFA